VFVTGALFESADDSDSSQADDDESGGASGTMSTVVEGADVFAVSLGSWHPQSQRVEAPLLLVRYRVCR
jgi:hypothetical protein